MLRAADTSDEQGAVWNSEPSHASANGKARLSPRKAEATRGISRTSVTLLCALVGRRGAPTCKTVTGGWESRRESSGAFKKDREGSQRRAKHEEPRFAGFGNVNRRDVPGKCKKRSKKWTSEMSQIRIWLEPIFVQMSSFSKQTDEIWLKMST